MSGKYTAVTIIVPVYADWPSLNECINSLKANIDFNLHQVILVNDCGPEVDAIEQSINSAITGHKGFIYYRNDRNLGFVGTCNRAVLELDKSDNDVLLLNSDTKTTEGFLEEMLGVLYSDSSFGVVSPRSNNATIATVPLWSASRKGIDQEESYKIFLALKDKWPRFSVVPVAHGFCMLIKRDLINKFGLFDPIFGKGYGEEVDYCQRILKSGFKSVLANHAYVFHLEARSFTLDTKNKLLEKNNKIIWQRYPKYRQSVRDYMEQALAQEKAIEHSMGFGKTVENHGLVKRLAKRSPVIYKMAKKFQARIKK